METYKNEYSKAEDIMLWELHEIRHDLHRNLESQSICEINKNATEKYLNWCKGKSELSPCGIARTRFDKIK